MIKNFDDVKKQLKELAEVVNGFKSEAVQLRIIELVFSLEPVDNVDLGTDNAVNKEIKKSVKKKKTKKSTGRKSSNKPSGQGAVATLRSLVEGTFFNKPKTITDIIEHCDQNLARKFKANGFSGTLGRLVRDGKLKRSKNSEGQYEYKSS